METSTALQEQSTCDAVVLVIVVVVETPTNKTTYRRQQQSHGNLFIMVLIEVVYLLSCVHAIREDVDRDSAPRRSITLTDISTTTIVNHLKRE